MKTLTSACVAVFCVQSVIGPSRSRSDASRLRLACFRRSRSALLTLSFPAEPVAQVVGEGRLDEPVFAVDIGDHRVYKLLIVSKLTSSRD